MDEQDKPINEPAPPERDDATGVGQVVQSLARVTRQLPTANERRTGATVANAAQRERIALLVAALGDPAHPLHQSAVEDLVALGDSAVPSLNESLRPSRPWLTAFRAAEALGQIGDGRAAGPLIEALRHPNSNVRWSAIRALATVGDARALLELRRVAREDRGKTSWGEPVGGAAQSALDQMQSRNMLLRGADLIKTAVACVVMLVALIVAYSVITSLREELSQVGQLPDGGDAPVAIVSTALPTDTAAPTVEPLPTTEPLATVEGATPAPGATSAAGGATGLITASGNVRSAPLRGADNVIGAVSEGDEVIFIAGTADGEWFRVRLGERRAAGSRITSADGTGWVARSLLTEPPVGLPVEDAPTPEPTLEPILEPTLEPTLDLGPTPEPTTAPEGRLASLPYGAMCGRARANGVGERWTGGATAAGRRPGTASDSLVCARAGLQRAPGSEPPLSNETSAPQWLRSSAFIGEDSCSQRRSAPRSSASR